MAVDGAAGCRWAKRAPPHDVAQHCSILRALPCKTARGGISVSLSNHRCFFFFFFKAKDRLHMGCARCGLTIHTVDLFSWPFFRPQ